MVKKVLFKHGLETALVAMGWIAFVGSFFINEPCLFFSLQVIARVLP